MCLLISLQDANENIIRIMIVLCLEPSAQHIANFQPANQHADIPEVDIHYKYMVNIYSLYFRSVSFHLQRDHNHP